MNSVINYSFLKKIQNFLFGNIQCAQYDFFLRKFDSDGSKTKLLAIFQV
jgi:hypothetical protein